MTKKDIQALAEEITSKLAIYYKDMLTADEAAAYCGLSRREITRKVSERQIRASRPGGKVLFIDRASLLEWMRSNPFATDAEINAKVEAYLATHR